MLPTVRLAGSRLSQASAPFQVVVVDPMGAPFSGALVTLQGEPVPVKTDSSGVARFTYGSSGEVVAVVQVGDFTVRARGRGDETLFVKVPVCSPGPLITTAELVVLLLGAGAAAVGAARKQRAIETVGEVLLGAGIFTAVYRHSCR